MTEVTILQKITWIGEELIVQVITDGPCIEQGHQLFHLKSKNFETATRIRAIMDAMAIRSKRKHEDEHKAERERKEKKLELENQRIARALELEKVMKSRYATGDFSGVTPNQFKSIIEELFKSMGYSLKHMGGRRDQGIDLICSNMTNKEVIVVQCKRYQREIGAAIVREFYGAFVHSRANKGYIITTSHFTKEAVHWVRGKQIELVHKHRLRDLMLKYYK